MSAIRGTESYDALVHAATDRPILVVDDYHPGRPLAIGRGEIAAPDQADAHRLVESRRDEPRVAPGSWLSLGRLISLDVEAARRPVLPERDVGGRPHALDAW